MSEQMILINKQDQEVLNELAKSSTFKDKSINKLKTTKTICRNRTNNNSIVKLLNIYKNKKEESEMEKMQK